MRDRRVPFGLAAWGAYALYSAFTWGKWQDLALWTRVHASINIGTGVSMLLCAAGTAAGGSRRIA